jgi:hypothetical protein
MEAVRTSETSVLTRVTRRNIPAYSILQLIQLHPVGNKLRRQVAVAQSVYFALPNKGHGVCFFLHPKIIIIADMGIMTVNCNAAFISADELLFQFELGHTL